MVGSLLRPTSLRHGVEEFYSEGHSAVLASERAKDRTGLRALEDEAIRNAVRREIDLWLDVVSDGEFRRWMFLNSFYDAVEGFRTDNVVTGWTVFVACGRDLRPSERGLCSIDGPKTRRAGWNTRA